MSNSYSLYLKMVAISVGLMVGSIVLGRFMGNDLSIGVGGGLVGIATYIAIWLWENKPNATEVETDG